MVKATVYLMLEQKDVCIPYSFTHLPAIGDVIPARQANNSNNVASITDSLNEKWLVKNVDPETGYVICEPC
ncbi:hypothetical protein H0A36_03790 [Endozoicomonas sp. SM1973]|uniref:Uncharacterized protein n=1 Tax=Spartinivicinus marinus TaxID=2994442 RepID=A0A853I330_9GAMM|nr:hypothetical protein [Spartinivicinus marinus]MCX4029544.1 hypothetical protein [Spartinivicinus marinus]NYZ65118.1 hypothetical protein [Spartinivicinus marinus]